MIYYKYFDKHRFHETTTPGFWRNTTHSITFTLVVDSTINDAVAVATLLVFVSL